MSPGATSAQNSGGVSQGQGGFDDAIERQSPSSGGIIDMGAVPDVSCTPNGGFDKWGYPEMGGL